MTIEHAAIGKTYVRWKILALICAASFIAYVLRTNLSIASESIVSDLGISEVQLGMVFSAFALGYAIFQFPGGLFGDKFGPRFALMAMAVCWGLLTVLTGLLPGSDTLSVGLLLATLVVVRFLVGVTQAPVFPVLTAGAVSNWFPAGGWGLPNGLSSTALTLGAAASAPLIVWLIDVIGWRGSFLVTAPMAFLLAAIWWWYARDYPVQHASVGEAELSLIDRDRPPPGDGKHVQGTWTAIIKDRNLLLLTASYFCMNYVFYLFFNWFFFYLVDVRGFSAQEAGIFTAAQWVLGSIGATAGGFGFDAAIKRWGLHWGARLLPVVSLFLCGVLLLVSNWIVGTYLTVVTLCVCFGLTQVTEAAFWGATITISGRHASAAAGVLNTGGNIVGFFGGMLVPLTAASFGWSVAMATGSIFAIVGSLLWLLIRVDRPIELPEG